MGDACRLLQRSQLASMVAGCVLVSVGSPFYFDACLITLHWSLLGNGDLMCLKATEAILMLHQHVDSDLITII